MEVQFYQHAFDNKGVPVPIAKVFKRIRSGLGGLAETVEELRDTEDKESREAIKKNLPCVTFTGTFGARKASEIIEYTGLVVVDIDKLDLGANYNRLEDLRQALMEDEHVFALFISPSGNGLKLVVPVNSVASKHKVAFEAVSEYFLSKYGIKIDASGKDISRLCFLSHDPEIHLNPEASVFEISEVSRVSKYVDEHFALAVKFVERHKQYIEGQRNTYIFALGCILNRFGISEQLGLEMINKHVVSKDPIPFREVQQTVKKAYQYNAFEFGAKPPKELSTGTDVVRLDIKNIYEDVSANKIFNQARLLFAAKVHSIDVYEFVRSMFENMRNAGKTTLSQDDFSTIMDDAYNDAKQGGTEVYEMKELTSMADQMMSYLMNSSFLTTPVENINDVLGGGLVNGNVYGIIGREQTFKTVLAMHIAIEAAINGHPALFINGEMSELQFFERAVFMMFGISLRDMAKNGQLTPEVIEELKNRMKEALGDNLIIESSVGLSGTDLANIIRRLDSQKKRPKVVIVDGISAMDSKGGKDFIADIENTKDLKEIAKAENLPICVLMHVKTGVPKHTRDTAEHVRGGMKLIANIDGYFCTSLCVDEKTSNLQSTPRDYKYKKDFYYLRFVDKRGSGNIVDIIMKRDEEKPLLFEPTGIEPSSMEVTED